MQKLLIVLFIKLKFNHNINYTFTSLKSKQYHDSSNRGMQFIIPKTQKTPGLEKNDNLHLCPHSIDKSSGQPMR